MTDDFCPAPDSVAVLCYHGVVLELADPDIQTVHLPVATFAQQLDFLARHYELISIDVLADALGRRLPLGAPKAIVTFDDGYRNVLTMAAPLLRARRIPFAVFVSTRHITTGERFPTYVLRAALYTTAHEEVYLPSLGRRFVLADRPARREVVSELLTILKRAPAPLASQLLRELQAQVPASEWPAIDAVLEADTPLDWSGVASLQQLGAVIGSHGHDHMILHERQSAGDVRYQLTESKRLIEGHVGPCRYFAYPNGGMHDISATAAELVGTCGYELGLAAVSGLIGTGVDCRLLPRIFAPSSADALPARLAGAAANMPRTEAWQASLGARTRHEE